MRFSLLSILALATVVAAHGIVKIPQRRLNGAALAKSCGVNATKVLNDDPSGPIENAVNKIRTDAAKDCDLYFCRGTKWEDQGGKYQQYKVGQVVNMQTDITAHHVGFANVSILSTTTKKAISSRLISWDPWGVYPWPEEEANWNITIPDLGTQCVEPGKCVIQWWWYSSRDAPYNGNNQTYESCIDFVTV